MPDVARIRSGRDDAFERARSVEAVSAQNRFRGILERHERRLRALTFSMLGDASRVDDVLQEAFVRVYRKLPDRFESERHETAWLYRVVYRCCLNELRSRRRRRETPGLAPYENLAAEPAPLEAVVLAESLAALPLDQRAVVLLVDQVGLDYETVASALHIPRGTVASRLNAARSRLRAALAEAGIHVDS
jgi:RNA polymerase sigma-70 factor (ECF subfamily)